MKSVDLPNEPPGAVIASAAHPVVLDGSGAAFAGTAPFLSHAVVEPAGTSIVSGNLLLLSAGAPVVPGALVIASTRIANLPADLANLPADLATEPADLPAALAALTAALAHLAPQLVDPLAALDAVTTRPADPLVVSAGIVDAFVDVVVLSVDFADAPSRRPSTSVPLAGALVPGVTLFPASVTPFAGLSVVHFMYVGECATYMKCSATVHEMSVAHLHTAQKSLPFTRHGPCDKPSRPRRGT
ncbi:MAG: hypothetical protein U0359_16690 [Byssovorax sp.]